MAKVHKDLVYKEDASSPYDQSLDLFLPSDSSSELPPLLVFVHGGLWLDRDKKQYEHIGHFFAERGFAVAVINYRKSIRNVPASPLVHPVHVQDLVDAVLYLNANKSNHPYDVKHIFLFGHSCGAHMITLPFLGRSAHLKNETFVPKGIIGLQGLYDLDLFVADAPQWIPDIEAAFTSNRNNWESPQKASDVGGHKEIAWLILHSPEDTAVNKNQAHNMADHLKQLGFPDVTLEEEITGGHDTGVSKIGTDLDVVSHVIFDFVLNHLS